MITKEACNERLLEQFGRHLSTDLPRFRVVWAPDELEKRTTELTDAGLYVEGFKQIREMPKYRWLGDQWVVERLHANYHKDVFEGNYVYECLVAFPEGLPLKWEPVEFACRKALSIIPNDDSVQPKTQKEAEYIDNEKKEKEKAAFRNMMDSTKLGSSLSDKNAQSYANNKGIDYRPSHQKAKEIVNGC